MSGAGKPLRFLGYVLGGWVMLRVGMAAGPALWPGTAPKNDFPVAREAPREAPAPPPEVAADGAPIMAQRDAAPAIMRIALREKAPIPSTPTDMPLAPAPALAAAASAEAPTPPPPRQDQRPARPEEPAPTNSALIAAPHHRPSRWSFSGWALWRRDAAASLAQGPLLGGSQGGLRLDYALWNSGTRVLGLYGRVTRALDRPFAEEAALGVALRPVEGLPVTLMAERRQRLAAGGRNGFAFLAAGGIGPKPIAPRLELEGYAQAGVVTLPGSVGFADGKLALGYRLTPRAKPDLAIGLSLSAGAQPGASRLDVGPELRLRLPVAGGYVRLSAEWRQRIAGTARPASGPAVALVADF